MQNPPRINFWNESAAQDFSLPVWEAYFILTDTSFEQMHGVLRNFFRLGIRSAAVKTVESQLKLENFGWNQLHLDVLTLDTLTAKYATISIGKKCNTQSHVTPVHLACINPNVAVLKTLLDQAPDFNMQDSSLAKPIHYAAACESSGPLKLLLELGANLNDLDNFKRTALHWAAFAGRAENVKIILQT